MARPSLEVADILNRHGDAFLARHRLSRGQLKVIGAIRACRTAALGGHVMRCSDCDHATIAYNSCRNRHCPRCQSAAAKDWLADRQADLLPVPYYHLVFSLPAPIAAIAFQNKVLLYDLLLRAAAQAKSILLLMMLKMLLLRVNVLFWCVRKPLLKISKVCMPARVF